MKRVLINLMFILPLTLVSCSDNDPVGGDGNGNGGAVGDGSITVTIHGERATRYVGDSNDPAVESIVTNLTVFVFNYVTGDLEQYQSYTLGSGEFTKQVTGLSTGTTKRVVAFVNVPTGVTFENVSTYADLNTNSITLDSQNGDAISTTGLFMSGEYGSQLTLAADSNNPINIPVRRRVAKVVLESLTIIPDAASNLQLFTLTGVSIQKARLTGTPLGGIVAPTGDATANYAGGISSPVNATPFFNLTKNYLLERLAMPGGYVSGTEIITNDSQQRYFYVLPNDGSNNNATLLCIDGTYGDNPENAYFPFIINSTVAEGEGATDGTFIVSNRIYGITATIRRLNLYSRDPNVVPSETVMDITVTPQGWDTKINQSVEW